MSSKLQKICLPKDAFPISRFHIRPEPFGYLLIHGNKVVPVTQNAKSILDHCDGNTKLEELSELYGQAGLDFIAKLYNLGMIKLR